MAEWVRFPASRAVRPNHLKEGEMEETETIICHNLHCRLVYEQVVRSPTVRGCPRCGVIPVADAPAPDEEAA